jgi:hypothetical protein
VGVETADTQTERERELQTLKLCLDEIRACRPFFIGLLGDRYGWVPGDDAFTADLKAVAVCSVVPHPQGCIGSARC